MLFPVTCLNVSKLSQSYADAQYDYMTGMSSDFYSITDAELLVEDQRLPVHKALLAGNSEVLANLFASNCAPGTTERKTEVPLHGESVKDVDLVLTFVYHNFTFKSQTKPIQSIDDAKMLATFAHKYNMRQMLSACEQYLISKAKDKDLQAKDGEQPLVGLSIFAEQCGLHKLLAHCENLLVRQEDTNLWQCKAVMSGQVSQGSLLRMLRAFQMQCTEMHSSFYGGYAASRHHAHRGFPTVTDMLDWQTGDSSTEKPEVSLDAA